jgi:arylsulfatase A-like enzyme
MSRLLSALLLAAAAVLPACPAPAGAVDGGGAGPAPPNFVFLLADDLGWTDLGVSGSSFYDTPSLDGLAAQGTRFTEAYAACPVCSPTRASILTGLYPARLGTTDYFGAAQPAQWKRDTPLLPAPYLDRLPLEQRTLAEQLKAAGYATFFAGKWHLGPEGFWPEDQGFDVNRGGITRGGPYGGDKYFSPYGNPRLEDGPPGEHLPARLAAETVAFLEQNRGRPFLAYLSFYSVHTPLMGRPDLVEKYRARKAERGLEARWGEEGARKVRLVQEHAVYAAMVEAMDQAVGEVLAALDRLGLAENTVVVFFSDNGGLSTSEGHPTSNLPLRAGKGWLYEGGVREPMIVRWPGGAEAGATCAEAVSSIDFLPTLLDIAGLEPEQSVDGRSLVPLLRGTGGLDREALFWHYPHYGNQGGRPGSAVRAGRWKLIEWAGEEQAELYDLAADPGETTDLAAREPERVAALRARLAAWREEVGARTPAPNPAWSGGR